MPERFRAGSSCRPGRNTAYFCVFIASLLLGLISMQALAGPGSGMTAADFHRLFQEFQRQGRPEPALAYLQAAVALAPGELSWQRELAELYESRDRLEEALEIYRSLLQEAGPDEELAKKVPYIEATLLAKQGRIGEAREIFSALAVSYPDDTLVLYSLGVADMLTNRLQDAEAVLKKVIRLDAAYANAYLNLATVYERQGRLADAVDTLQALVEHGGGEMAISQARLRLDLIEARLLIEAGNLHEALDVVSPLLETAPDNLAVLVMAADLQQRLGNLEEEEQLRKRLLRRQPGNPFFMMRLAEIYLATNRLGDAFDLLEKISEEARGTPFARQAEHRLSQLLATPAGQLLAQEKEEAEIARYRALIDEDPDDFNAHWELARLYLQRGQFDEARRELEAVMRLRPDFHQGRVVLASVYDQLGLFAEAVDAYALAIAQVPDPEVGRSLVQELILANAKKLYVEERLELAVHEFERVLAGDPENALAHFYLGLIYSTRQELIKAADQYQTVLRLIPTHVGARFNLATSFERMNREEDAIEEYRKILQSNPPEELAESVRARLRATERRIRGLVASLGYIMSLDDNTNLSEKDNVEDYRSNLTLSLAYQYKMKNGVRLRLSTMPSYEVYHEGQFDFLNTSTTVSATYIPRGVTLVGGYTYRTSMGLVNANRFSRSNTFFAEGFARVRLPQLLRPFRGEKVYTGISANLSYTDFEADDSPFFSAYTTAAGITLRQPLMLGADISLGYSFVNNDNQEFIGNDYAYVSHGVRVGLERGFSSGIVLNADLRYTRLNYKNPDSFSRFTEKRRNERYNAVVGASYRLRNDITLFANLSWTRNLSNLPVGFILNPADIVEGQQSSSLSDYDRVVFSSGINVSF